MGSTLSLAPTNRSSSEISSQVRQLQEEWGRQQELTPLHKQDWFAGQIDIKTATDRIRNLPTGTFLVRNRKTENNEDFALDLKARIGVKHMKIYVESDENCGKVYSFSPARSFSSLVQLINYYRSNDLLENFGYKELEGVKLNNPYKSA